MITEASSKPRFGFTNWIRSSHGAWALLSVLLPITIVLGLGVISALFFSSSYAEFSIERIGIIEGPYGFPVIAGTITNSGKKTADVTILGKCLADEIPIFYGKNFYDMSLWFFTGKPPDLLEFENTLAPGQSGSFLFQLNDAEAKNTPLPRKFATYKIAASDFKLGNKIMCDRAEVIVFGETSGYDQENQEFLPFIFGGMVIVMLVLGLRWYKPPIRFKWKHTFLAFALSIILLLVNYQIEVTRLTPYPYDFSEAFLMLLMVYGLVGVIALVFSAAVWGLHSLFLKIMRRRS